jgi:ComF family protein
MSAITNSLTDILHVSLDFLFPHMCLLCETETTDGFVCNNCLDYIPLVNPPLCHRCGRPIKNGTVCHLCTDAHALDHGRAWILFIPPSDKLIHHFKYRKKTRLVHLLGRAMASLIRTDYELNQADVIVPVPLFWWKKLRRGYNQASLLAHIISQETNISEHHALRRVKNTRTQTRLKESERQDNVMNAFAVETDGVENKKVLLVDDVLTTGATMNECARVLKQAGAQEVYSCVAAITPG